MTTNGKQNGNGQAESAALSNNIAMSDGHKARISLVEDEPAMVAGLRDNFEYEGYEVISAGDGVEGLERALADNPDLVVLDVMMPRMSGLDVCKQFAVLAYFIANPARTLTRDRLLDAVWGYENYPNTRTVDAHIVHLRQKLEPNPEEPRFILTVHGSGYKFVG